MNFTENLEKVLSSLVEGGMVLAKNIVFAVIVYFAGKYLIKTLYKIIKRIMERRNIDASVQSFVNNLIKIVLQVTLFIVVIGVLGIKTASIMTLIAGASVGIGLALSGTLQNFANGIMLLLFRPYKVGDYIETQGIGGTVKEVQIFHTILKTADNKTIYVPNGTMNTSVMANFSQAATRRIDLTVGIDYGEDFDKVKSVVSQIIARETRILAEPQPLIEITKLADSSVNVIVRIWVKSADYWNVYFNMNQTIYATFNENKINFPFPQLTIHQG
jgi:small conductance mechanosensitive channel